MLLAGPVCSWQDLDALGRIRMLLARPACFWQDLDAFGRVWMLLAGPACFWQDLDAFGRFWMLLAGPACFWQDLDALSRTCMLLEESVCFLGQVSPQLLKPTHDMKVTTYDTSLISKRICSIVLKQHTPHYRFVTFRKLLFSFSS
jgi:hypothetical protein